MGQNGAGKSSLAYTIMGHPKYSVTSGKILFDGQDITEKKMFERARMGLFLGVQSPPIIEGVSVFSFLKEAKKAITGADFSLFEFHEDVALLCKTLNIDLSFLDKSLNDGFSGGEKKKIELLQMLSLQPKIVILDEIDSGLDVDSLGLVSKSLLIMKKKNPDFSVIIISHSTRLLNTIDFDSVHVIRKGKIIRSGDRKLALEIEQKGFDEYATARAV